MTHAANLAALSTVCTVSSTGNVVIGGPGASGALNVTPISLGAIGTLGTITPGSGYSNGTFTAVPLTGGTGTGATANITVSGGSVTACALNWPGYGYVPGDTLSVTAAGTGFSIPVVTLSGALTIPGGIAFNNTGNRIVLRPDGSVSHESGTAYSFLSGLSGAALTGNVYWNGTQYVAYNSGSSSYVMSVSAIGTGAYYGTAAVNPTFGNTLWSATSTGMTIAVPLTLSGGTTTSSGIYQTSSNGSAYASGFQVYTSGVGAMGWYDSSQTTDQKCWDMFMSSSTFGLRTINDAASSANYVFQVTRTGYVPSTMSFYSGMNVGMSQLNITSTGNNVNAFKVTDTGTSTGANVMLAGNGSTTPYKSWRAFGGSMQMVNSAYTATPVSIDDTGDVVFNGNVTAYSDPRLKTNIVRTILTQAELAAINLYSFRYKASNRQGVGGITTEIANVLPEMIGSDDKGFHTLDYAKTAFAHSVSSYYHTTAELNKLKNRITELEHLLGQGA